MADIRALSFDDIPSPDPKGRLSSLSFDDVPIAPDDPGILGAMGLGFGRTMDKLVQGTKQAVFAGGTLLPGNAGDAAQAQLDQLRRVQGLRDEGYAPLQNQHPVATVVGESAPMLALPMGGSLRAAAAIGSVPGLLSYGTPQEKLVSGGLGAVGSGMGYGLGKGVAALASPGMKPNPEISRLAQVAADNNIPLDAAQLTGNPVLQNIKSALASVPWTASNQAARAGKQQEAFNSAVLKYSGADAKAATPDVMGDAYSAIIGKKNAAAADVNLTLDDPALAKLAEVEKTYTRRLPTDQKAVIGSYIQDITDMIDKPMSGDVYVKTRSALGQIASSTDNMTMREGAKGLQGVLDDAFDRQASPEAVAQMKAFRSEYSKYLTTADAMKKARSGSDIPAKQLYAQAQQDIPGFERKTDDFVNLVRAGRQFLPDPIPNSGTAQRQIYNNLLTAGSLTGLGAVGGALTPDKEGQRHVIPGALMGLAGFGLSHGTGYAISRSAAGAMNSDWLAKYLMSAPLSNETKALIAKSGGLLGYGATAPAAGLLLQ